MSGKRFFLAGLFLLGAVVVGTVLFLSPSAQAAPTATITVTTTDDVIFNNGQCSLREAVIAANKNTSSGNLVGECAAGSDTETDIITLADGATYTLAIAGTAEDESLTGDLDILQNTAPLDVQFIVANDGSATIDADGIDRTFHVIVATVEFNNITLINGSTVADNGGNLYNADGVVTLNDSTLSKGQALSGGAVFNFSSTATGGRLVLNNTQIILSMANSGGGITSSGNDPMVTVNNSIVRANTVNGNGGGIYAVKGTVTVTNGSRINLNQAADGGGIYASSDTIVTIDNAEIGSNGASNDGAGIYLLDVATIQNFSLLNSSLNGNVATGDGGGIYVNNTGALNVDNSDFSANEAANGGAIYGIFAIIKGGAFDGNSATNEGGAIYLTTLNATNIQITNNQAGQNGGGVYAKRSVPVLAQSSVLSNTAGTNGGGLYITDAPATTWVSNISQTAVANNQATGDGGGIWADESDIIVSNSTISSNRANSNGGGFYIENSTTVTATNVTIALNMPGQDIYKVGKLTLQNSIIHTPDTPNCFLVATPINSLGNNLTDDASCDGLNQTGDVINSNSVLLAPLADNGGNTLTHNLLDGSEAIDSGNAAACVAAPVNNVDQRGTPRIIGSACDKGAVERGSVVFTPIILK